MTECLSLLKIPIENKNPMRFFKIYFLFILFITSAGSFLFAQSYKVAAVVKGLPGDEVVIGAVRGEKFNPADTVMPQSDTIVFEIPQGAHTGMYRIILGQSVYARVMHTAPQKIDFIFNNDSCFFETDFNSPVDSMQVKYSRENEVWFRFLKKENEYQKQIVDLRKQIDYFQENNDDDYYTESKRKEIINKYNALQKERARFIASLIKRYPKLYATKLIAVYKEPFMDGNLPEAKRKDIYKKNFFRYLNFSDPSLLNSNVYTKKVFEYLMSYADKNLDKEQQTREMNKAIDVIIDNTKSNPEVSDFIVNYLMRGFEILGFEDQLQHIAENYTPAIPCTSENKSTLQRRIDLQKMRPGSEVPDFSLTDIDGDTITLSDITNKYKLIVFWATWCPHCEQMMPKLYQWYINRDIDIEVIAISVDSDVNSWKQFVKERGYNWVNCNEPGKWNGKVALAYNIYATPTMFLIDSDGKIIAKPLSFNDFLDSVIGLK